MMYARAVAGSNVNVVNIEPRQAVRRTLVGRAKHKLDRHSVGFPLLDPFADDLPFACFLELHNAPETEHAASITSSNSAAAPTDPNILEMIFVLEGNGQLVQYGTQEVSQLAAGDSILMPLNAASCIASDSAACDGDTWHMATLRLFIDVQRLSNAPIVTGGSVSGDLDAAVGAWREAPFLGCLYGIAAQQLSQRLAITPSGGSPSLASSIPTAATESAQTDGAAVSAAEVLKESPERSDGEGEQRWSDAVQWLRHGGAAVLQRIPATAWALKRGFADRLGNKGSSSADPTPAASAVLGVVQRHLKELDTFQLPNQTNRLALAFSPLDGYPFLAGLEIFEAGHRTAPHVHQEAYELFFVISGEGEAFCGDARFSCSPGDVVVFPPAVVHGIDNGNSGSMYCVEVLLPTGGPDAWKFAEFVRTGSQTALSDAEMDALVAPGCAS